MEVTLPLLSFLKKKKKKLAKVYYPKTHYFSCIKYSLERKLKMKKVFHRNYYSGALSPRSAKLILIIPSSLRTKADSGRGSVSLFFPGDTPRIAPTSRATLLSVCFSGVAK